MNRLFLFLWFIFFNGLYCRRFCDGLYFFIFPVFGLIRLGEHIITGDLGLLINVTNPIHY